MVNNKLISSSIRAGWFGEPSWLDMFIESGIKNIVKLLRDNGVNTVCSCEHLAYVECEWYNGDDVDQINRLLFHNGYTDFEIEGWWSSNGHRSLTIKFPKLKVPRIEGC